MKSEKQYTIQMRNLTEKSLKKINSRTEEHNEWNGNATEDINNRIDQIEERINELEDRKFETIQSEEKKRRKNESKESLCGLCDSIKK